MIYEREANYLACSVDNNTDRKMHDIIFDQGVQQRVFSELWGLAASELANQGR